MQICDQDHDLFSKMSKNNYYNFVSSTGEGGNVVSSQKRRKT